MDDDLSFLFSNEVVYHKGKHAKNIRKIIFCMIG